MENQKMTYALEGFIEKIDCPVIIEYNGQETLFPNGKDAMTANWEEKMNVASITVRNNCIILKMEQVKPMPPVNWIGEEAVD